jgi:hypothetical protein
MKFSILGPGNTISRAHWSLGNSDGYLKKYYKISTYTNLTFPKCIDKYLGNAKLSKCKYSSHTLQ